MPAKIQLWVSWGRIFSNFAVPNFGYQNWPKMGTKSEPKMGTGICLYSGPHFGPTFGTRFGLSLVPKTGTSKMEKIGPESLQNGTKKPPKDAC